MLLVRSACVGLGENSFLSCLDEMELSEQERCDALEKRTIFDVSVSLLSKTAYYLSGCFIRSEHFAVFVRSSL